MNRVWLTVLVLAAGCNANEPCRAGFGQASDGNCYALASGDLPTDPTPTATTGTTTGTTTPPITYDIFLGDITFDSEVTMVAFCERYDAVYGNVTVSGAVTNTDALACLRAVYGTLTVTDEAVGGTDPTLESVVLPALELVDADLRLETLAIVTSVRLPALVHIGGRFDAEQVDSLEFDFGSLASVGGEVSLVGFGAGGFGPPIRFPALVTVGGGLAIFACCATDEISAPLLRTIGGGLVVQSDINPWELNLAALEEVDGDFRFDGEGTSTYDALGNLREITGNLMLTSNPRLVDVTGLMGLSTIGGNFEVSGNTSLPQSQVDALVAEIGAGIAGAISIGNNGPG